MTLTLYGSPAVLCQPCGLTRNASREEVMTFLFEDDALAALLVPLVIRGSAAPARAAAG